MNCDPLVVLSYPGHFLQTALTIQSFLQYNDPVPTTVLVDDLSPYAWPDYVKHCNDLYNTTTIPISTLSISHHYAQKENWWIRQQMVKLHLDLLLPYDRWFFTDGDIEFFYPVPVNKVPYTITRPGGEYRRRNNQYVSAILGIDNPGIYEENSAMNWIPGTTRHQVVVSSPPFRTMQAQVLQTLRSYVEQLHGKSFLMVHSYLEDLCGGCDNYLESEWELIESFRRHILDQDIHAIYYPIINNFTQSESNISHEFCATTFASDFQIGRNWFAKKNITTTDNIWQHLEKIIK